MDRPVTADSASDPKCALSREAARMLVHDVRAPLTAIVGFIELLRRAQTAEERDEILGGLERAARRMDNMLDAALKGRFEPSAARTDSAEFDLFEVARDAVTEMAAATGRAIALAGAPAIVRGDALLVRRALDNLLGNAVKYSPADAPVDASVSAAHGPVVFEVADRGPGIPAEERERVVLPFERLERDLERPGTGLGLAVVSSAAERHGARFELLDREGGGTVARISFPTP